MKYFKIQFQRGQYCRPLFTTCLQLCRNMFAMLWQDSNKSCHFFHTHTHTRSQYIISAPAIPRYNSNLQRHWCTRSYYKLHFMCMEAMSTISIVKRVRLTTTHNLCSLCRSFVSTIKYTNMRSCGDGKSDK